MTAAPSAGSQGCHRADTTGQGRVGTVPAMSEPHAAGSCSLVVRVWLPDRPGALGQVASRIGALHGDVTAIDILERGAGKVIDELVVSLPAGVSLDLLAKEIKAVDGAAIEHIRAIDGERPDSATAVLELAASLAETSSGSRLQTVCDGLVVALDADWAVGVSEGAVVSGAGKVPDREWIRAFLEGSGHLDGPAEHGALEDVAWATVKQADLTLAVGRSARALHDRERARLAALTRVVAGLLA